MDQDDVDRFGTQRAAEIGAPLVAETVERLGLDLHADNNLVLRVLVDLTSRLFAAGYNFAITEATARFLEQLPAEVGDRIKIRLRVAGHAGVRPAWRGSGVGRVRRAAGLNRHAAKSGVCWLGGAVRRCRGRVSAETCCPISCPPARIAGRAARFGHKKTPPERGFLSEPASGLEPETPSLQVKCSTN
jgi:hypothetical protein